MYDPDLFEEPDPFPQSKLTTLVISALVASVTISITVIAVALVSWIKQ